MDHSQCLVNSNIFYQWAVHNSLFFLRSFAISLCATQGIKELRRCLLHFLLPRSLQVKNTLNATTNFDFFLILNSALVGTQKLGSFTLLCLIRLVEQTKMVSISPKSNVFLVQNV
jgi:hypothetical protein